MRKNRTWYYTPGLLILVILVFLGCENKEYDRDKGPSDIRIKNMSSQVFDSIYVNTSGGEHSYGALNPGSESEYKRYDFGYPIADISVYINMVEYTYGPVNYTYEVWLGKGKFTYELSLADTVSHTLSIEVTLDAPLD